MNNILIDVPCIDKVMTKKEQAKALVNELLLQLQKPKGKLVHSDNQEKEAEAMVVKYFPDLKNYI